MRVLHVIPSLNVSAGGPTRALGLIERALVVHGVSVTTGTTEAAVGLGDTKPSSVRVGANISGASDPLNTLGPLVVQANISRLDTFGHTVRQPRFPITIEDEMWCDTYIAGIDISFILRQHLTNASMVTEIGI